MALVGVGIGVRDLGEGGLPRAVLDAQKETAIGSAQQVRRSLNEGSDDLWDVARALVSQVQDQQVPAEQARRELGALTREHQRYLTLALVSARTGRPVLAPAGEALPGALGRLPNDHRLVRLLPDGRLVESVPLRSGADLLLAAVYDPVQLVPDLLPAAGFYLVGRSSSALFRAGTAGRDAVIDGEVREAAHRGVRGAGTLTRPAGQGRVRLLSYAPVLGAGPAGEAGLAVVLVRETAMPASGTYSFLLPDLGRSAALLLVTALVFWWLHVALIRPLLELQVTSERVAYGDLSLPVVVTRYDEVGEAGRALERLRLELIRAEVQDLQPRAEQRLGTEERS